MMVQVKKQNGLVNGWLVEVIENDVVIEKEFFKYKASAIENAKKLAEEKNASYYEYDTKGNLKAKKEVKKQVKKQVKKNKKVKTLEVVGTIVIDWEKEIKDAKEKVANAKVVTIHK